MDSPKKPEQGTLFKDAFTTEKIHDGSINDLVRNEQVGIGFSAPVSVYFELVSIIEYVASTKAVSPLVADYKSECMDMLNELFGHVEAEHRVKEYLMRILLTKG